jgi:hypothetical protein
MKALATLFLFALSIIATALPDGSNPSPIWPAAQDSKAHNQLKHLRELPFAICKQVN